MVARLIIATYTLFAVALIGVFLRKRLAGRRKESRKSVSGLRFRVRDHIALMSVYWGYVYVPMWIVTGEFRTFDMLLMVAAMSLTIMAAAFACRAVFISPIASLASLTRSMAEIFPRESGIWWARKVVKYLGPIFLMTAPILIGTYVYIMYGDVKYSTLAWAFSLIAMSHWAAQWLAILPLMLHEGLDQQGRLYITTSLGVQGVVPVVLSFIGTPPPIAERIGIDLSYMPVPIWPLIVIVAICSSLAFAHISGNVRRRTAALSGLDEVEYLLRVIGEAVVDGSVRASGEVKQFIERERQGISEELATLTTPPDILFRAFLAEDSPEARSNLVSSATADTLPQEMEEEFRTLLIDFIENRSNVRDSIGNSLFLSAQRIMRLLHERQADRIVSDGVKLTQPLFAIMSDRKVWLSNSAWLAFVNTYTVFIDELFVLGGRFVTIFDNFDWRKNIPSWLYWGARGLQFFGFIATGQEIRYSVSRKLYVAKLQASYIGRAPLEDLRWKRVICINRLGCIASEMNLSVGRDSIREMQAECQNDRQALLDERSHWGKFAIGIISPVMASILTRYLFDVFGWI